MGETQKLPDVMYFSSVYRRDFDKFGNFTCEKFVVSADVSDITVSALLLQYNVNVAPGPSLELTSHMFVISQLCKSGKIPKFSTSCREKCDGGGLCLMWRYYF